MSYLELKGISKRFGESIAVDSVDLEVGESQLMVILGPSGCGKSTLLRIVSGLETPDRGKVFLQGKDITEMTPRDRDIAMVFQDYALYPHMTLERNLTFGLTMRNMGRKEARERARGAAALLGIGGLLKRKPGQLSGGEKQRVALGRAIVKDPRLFLMDEPLSNIDALLRGKMRTEITRIMKELGATLLYVTHDQVEAMTMGDDLAIMKDGSIVQVAPPDKMYERPETIFVASFLGNPPMNFIRPKSAIYDKINEMSSIKGEKYSHTAGMVFGIRPEDIKIGQGDFVGTITSVETLGYESIVSIFAEDTSLTVRVTENPPGLNERVSFRLDIERLHPFDGQTGMRIVKQG